MRGVPEREVQPSESVVYVIGSDAFRPVKIGWSTNLPIRFAALDSASPAPLYVMWTVEGGRALELRLHKDLARFRVRGEWFDFLSHDPVVVVSKAAASITGLPVADGHPRPAKMRAEPTLRRGERARLPGAPRRRRKYTPDRVLDLLRGRGPMTTAMLLDHLNVGPSTVVSALKRLEQVGLVEHLAYGLWVDCQGQSEPTDAKRITHQLPESEANLEP